MKNPKPKKKCKKCNKEIEKSLNINSLGAGKYCSTTCFFLSKNPAIPAKTQVQTGTTTRNKSTFKTSNKPSVTIELNKVLDKDTPDRDAKYLAFVRKMPCIVGRGCSDQVHAHHAVNRGMGIKGSDYSVVPLCLTHHTGDTFCIHKLSNKEFEEVHGVSIKDSIINNLTKYIRTFK